MIYARPRGSFEATVTGAPTGLTGQIGVRILDNVGGTPAPRTTEGVKEFPPNSGFYAVVLQAPAPLGQYSVLWDTGAVTPSTTAAEDLTVTSSGSVTVGAP